MPKRKRTDDKSNPKNKIARTLDDSSKAHAIFASASYKEEHKDRKKFINHKLDNSDWIEDAELSTEHQRIFVNSKEKKVVTSYRGTYAGDLSHDLLTDIAIAIGFEHKTGRFKKAEESFKDTVLKYEDYSHTVTGHSLGGSIARHVLEKHEPLIDEAHIFNPGVGLGYKKHWFTKKEVSDKLHGHYIAADPVSALGVVGRQNVHLYPPPSTLTKAHSIDNFIMD